MRKPFELILFSVDTSIIPRAATAGIDSFIVDLEYLGKEERQWGADTEINHNSLEDLCNVRKCTESHLICRINQRNVDSFLEIDEVIASGANEILVPMVKNVGDVEYFLKYIDNRCHLSVMLETIDAFRNAKEIGQLPLRRVYVGLNDLAIQRRTPNIFTSLVDGTIDSIREYIRVPFGLAGLTLPDLGEPIPCRLLMSEMARLECSFTFLRRSFWRDTAGLNLMHVVPQIKSAIEGAFLLPDVSRTQLRDKLIKSIEDWIPEYK